MANPCTSAVNILPAKDVNASKQTDTFALNEDVLARCIDTKSNYFPQFCLYPPTQDLLEMCQDPPTFNPSFLFSQMLDNQFTNVSKLPLLISYPRFAGSGDWTPQSQVNPIVGTNIVLNESFTGHTEWFIGTTTVPLNSLPSPLPVDIPLVRSQHSLVQCLLPAGSSEIEAQFANVPQILVADSQRVIRLYDNGNVRVFANALDDAPIIWESFTSDQYGSDVVFTELTQPFESTVPGTLAAIVSPSGVYMLIVMPNVVTIAFLTFNNPRFTASTQAQNNLEAAASAQSQFCFQALNKNQATQANARSDLAFADPRCNCLASDRLTKRVFDPTTFETLETLIRLRLRDTTPCLLRKCQMLPGEYTNANLRLANTCIASNGFCSSILPTTLNSSMYVAQDCMVNVAPCTTSSDCPLGSNCRNRQCFLNCTSDLPCLRANPLASCVNGQCQTLNPAVTNDDTTTWMWVGLALCVIVIVILLALIVHFALRKK